MEILDFSSLPYSNRNGSYGGVAGDKDGVLIEGKPWIVKYPKPTIGMTKADRLSPLTLTPISEYIGSHIYSILGYPVQETILGIRKGYLVVACKDFCDEETRLFEMRTLKNIHLEEMRNEFGLDLHETGDDKLVSLPELFIHFRYNPEIAKIEGISKRFWDQVVIDGLLSNNDRNNGNWGVLVKGNKRNLAPIFDNGASFYPKKNEEAIRETLSLSPEEQRRNNANAVEPYTLDGTRHLNYRTILSLSEQDIPIEQVGALKEAILKNTYLVKSHMGEIRTLFDSVPSAFQSQSVLSSERKKYYLQSFENRFQAVLLPRCQELEQ
jgi:hypothetical protein